MAGRISKIAHSFKKATGVVRVVVRRQQIIRSWNEMAWIKIGDCYVRCDKIEYILDDPDGSRKIRTVSGMAFTESISNDKEFRRIVKNLGFNE